MSKPSKRLRDGLKPPAYPQVEFIQDIQSIEVYCRYCGTRIDDKIWDDLTKKDVESIRSGKPMKWACNCNNIVKMILENE